MLKITEGTHDWKQVLEVVVSQLHLELVRFSPQPWYVSEPDKPKDIHLLVKTLSSHSHQFSQNVELWF